MTDGDRERLNGLLLWLRESSQLGGGQGRINRQMGEWAESLDRLREAGGALLESLGGDYEIRRTVGPHCAEAAQGLRAALAGEGENDG